MFKIMLGLATLFVGGEAICNAIADDMKKRGEDVSVEALHETDVLNVL